MYRRCCRLATCELLTVFYWVLFYHFSCQFKLIGIFLNIGNTIVFHLMILFNYHHGLRLTTRHKPRLRLHACGLVGDSFNDAPSSDIDRYRLLNVQQCAHVPITNGHPSRSDRI